MSSIASRRPHRQARKPFIQPDKPSAPSWTPPRPPTPFVSGIAASPDPSDPFPPPSSPLTQFKSLSRSPSPQAPSEIDRLLSPVIEDPAYTAKQYRREKNRQHCLKYRRTPKGRARAQAASSKFSKTPAGRALRKKYYYSALGQANEARSHIRRRIEKELRAATVDLVTASRADGKKGSQADVARARLMVKVAQGHMGAFMRQKEERRRRLYGWSIEETVEREEENTGDIGREIEELKQSVTKQKRETWEAIERYLEENEGL